MDRIFKQPFARRPGTTFSLALVCFVCSLAACVSAQDLALPAKKTFGDPYNRLALISLLNAILMLDLPIVDVVIQNPYNEKDFEDDKLTILDIKAIDSSGAIYNIEMQISVCAGLVNEWFSTRANCFRPKCTRETATPISIQSFQSAY